jgi:ABC-type phosphate transport system substrate-binding protein
MNTKTFVLTIVALLGVVCFANTKAHAEKLYVVIGGGISPKEISKGALKSICMGKTTYWKSGKKISLLMRPANSPAGDAIYKSILKMVPSRYQHYWNEQKLSGRGIAPRSVSSGAKVVKMVGSRAGAIGFISESERKQLGNTNAKIFPIK